MDMDEILEPEPLSKDDQLWRNNMEYQILNYIINYIENCDLLMLDYANHELYSYSPRSEIRAIIQIIHTKHLCILDNTKVSLVNGIYSNHSLMNKIYSNHLQHRYINTNIDYSNKDIQEFIKFIDYNKETKSNFDFERFRLLNRQMIARIEYERNKSATLYRKNREEIKIREKIEKETGNKLSETYGKKHTCHIS
jgi:hypothetical protein